MSGEGEIDIASAMLLRSALDELGVNCDVLVDVASVSFMDSSGLNVGLAVNRSG